MSEAMSQELSGATTGTGSGASTATTWPTEVRARTGILTTTRAELRRLRRWPAMWVILGTWAVMTLTFGYVFDYVSYRTGDTGFVNRGASTDLMLAELLPDHVPDTLLQGMPMFGGALMMVLGALVAGNGYAWGTWKTVFTQGRSRTAVVAGSIVAVITLAGTAVLLTLALSLGTSLAIAGLETADAAAPEGAELLRSLGAGFLVMTMWALAGYALGTVTRSATLSVGLGLVWSLVVENLLRGVGEMLSAVGTFAEFLPGTASGSLVGALVEVPASGDATPGVLTVLGGERAAGTLVAYLVVLILLTLVLTRHRDVV